MEQYLSQTQQQRMQMVLAPQLRQSLEMLQVPILELRSLIQQEIEQNPTLEDQPAENEQVEIEPGSGEQEENDEELNFDEEFEVLKRLDDEWRDYFSQNTGSAPYTKDDEARRNYFLDSLSQETSLQEHLMNQLALSDLEEEDRRIGEMIIGSINDDGYLDITMEDLSATTGYPEDRLSWILEVIREFDPIGVGAYTLRECLLFQLVRLGKVNTPEYEVVDHHLDALGSRKYQDIARKMKISVEEVQKLAAFVSTLEPKPGRRFTAEASAYVLPEVQVQYIEGEYKVALNDDQIPHLRISNHYKRLMEDPSTPRSTKSYIREKVRAGAFMIKSINQRQQTIHNIATEMLKVQRDFFEHGVSHLKPLTMAEIADVLGIHETTVSRAIANKYMQTPRGTFEMKYFFTPGYKTAEGKSVSNKTVKDAIEQMIKNEDKSSPLSDQAIANQLKEDGTKVARRTVAKYREELNILPSHMRKSF